MAGPLSAWPWESLGSYKYMLYGPFLGKAIYSWLYEDGQKESLCLHILLICSLRGLIHQLWLSFSNMLFLTRNRIVIKQGIDFKQIDREWDWDNFIILHAFMAAWACYSFPLNGNLPLWDWRGCVSALIIHMGVSEPLYYCIHRCFHGDYLFTHYHSIHHSSVVTQSFTAGSATLLEHIILGVIMGVPVVGPTLMGCGSTSLIYGYAFIFDFLRCMGHSNVEVIPHGLFDYFPFLRYLLYTATYHSLHHTEMGTNYCLFMPIYDKLGKTLNDKSWDLHKKITSVRNGPPPDFVFLAHAVDVMSSLHVPFFFRSISSMPFAVHLILLPLWPSAFLILLVMWASSKTFLLSYYTLRGQLQQTWVVPRTGFQYFLPFARDGINYHIEYAILRADRLGVKVLSLAALNKMHGVDLPWTSLWPPHTAPGTDWSQAIHSLFHDTSVWNPLSYMRHIQTIHKNESLNGGGSLFVSKLPNLKVRIVHGNTLTAAVILNQINKNTTNEVFLTGATSKLGRAIALYLCRMKIRVMMLTPSIERFQTIRKEAPVEFRRYLVHVRKYQAAQDCKTWIVGKWLSLRQQRWAPSGTHFHQFVVPPIISFRRDCTYVKLAAMKLPEDVQGLGSCEYTMGRGVIHACHAGGIVHHLEGWTHHEVGPIDVDRIDLVWKSALKHGLKPV